MSELVRYDAACKALAEARSVDEVKDIPNCSGVYFFFQDNRAIYVGRAKNLRKRLTASHHRCYLFDCNLQLWIYPSIEYQELETELIKLLRPLHQRRPVWKCDPNFTPITTITLDQAWDGLFGPGALFGLI